MECQACEGIGYTFRCILCERGIPHEHCGGPKYKCRTCDGDGEIEPELDPKVKPKPVPDPFKDNTIDYIA
jgi:hypothetical protein